MEIYMHHPIMAEEDSHPTSFSSQPCKSLSSPQSKAEASFLYNGGGGERKRKWREARKRLMYGGSLKLKF
jgi:hypothetical protein